MIDAGFDAVERAARESYGRLMAMLVMRTRDVAGAEDALGEAMAQALTQWRRSGVPANPEAWLLTAARRRQIDAARRRATAGTESHQRHVMDDLIERAESAATRAEADMATRTGERIPDERLELLFLCAHPDVEESARTPLMLQAVLGIEARHIAAAFLVPPATMAQRLVRAKRRIADDGIEFRLPPPAQWPARLDAVLEAIYVAYTAGTGDESTGLASEAVELGRVLARLAPEPEAQGLAALMLYAHARRRARRDAAGRYVPLPEQDVELWDAAMIDEAESLLLAASRAGRLGRFQLEAAIQSAHCDRRRSGRTDWPAIVGLYDGLIALAPTVGAIVGRAAALGEASGPAAGLAALSQVDANRAATYQPYHATRAHLLAMAGNPEQSREAYDRAIGLSDDEAVRAFLLRQLDALPPAKK